MRSQILMLLAFIISLSACKKDNEAVISEAENKIAMSKSASDEISPENPENAFDSIGYWHNQIVAYVQNCKPVTDTPDVAASTQCVLRFCRETKRIEPPASFFLTVTHTVRQSNENIETLIANCPYEEPVKAALDSLAQLIKRLSKSNSPYPVIKAMIVDFESRIMQE